MALSIAAARVDGKTEKAIRALLSKGTGINRVARMVGIGTGTVQRVKAAALPRKQN